MYIEVGISQQKLQLVDNNGDVIMDTLVSTARNGPGERVNSECTPRGAHVVRARIGEGCPVNTVFRGRRPTGEVFTPPMRARFPRRDWILTRILWLSGMEAGVNRLGPVDTMRRYIYIHGAPDNDVMGVPGSHGCIKMSNPDVMTLFDRVEVGTLVVVKE